MFSFKTIVLSAVLILLLTSVAVQVYNIYSMAQKKSTNELYKDKSMLFYTPTVINLVGMALVGILFVMG